MDNIETSQPSDEDLFSEGMKFIDDALSRFMDIDSDHSRGISKILHGALLIAETAYAIMKK